MGETNQYLTFTLEGECYALSVLKVREVLEYTKITKIPRTADFMKGVINLRGTGVPVIDLRIKFGMSGVDHTRDTSIIVMEVEGTDGTIILGALADSVQEVIELEPSHIEPAPRFGTRLATDFILGMGKKNNDFIILLDMDKIFTTEDANFLNTVESPVEMVNT